MKKDPIIPVGPFPRGVNNVARETALPEGAVRDAVNVDVTDAGWFRRRRGATKVLSGSGVHSLREVDGILLLVSDGWLSRFNPTTHTLTPLAELTDALSVMSYAYTGHEIVYCNGRDAGRFVGPMREHRPLFVPNPGPLSLAANSGSMTPGTYRFVAAYVLPDGQLSGTSRDAAITLSGAGVTVAVPAPPAGYPVSTYLYMTPPNGDVFYRVATVPYGVSEWVFSSDPARDAEVETLHLQPIPLGSIVRFHAGRLYMASGRKLSASRPFRYGLTRLQDDYLLFPDDISVVEPVVDGIYVVADKTYFLAGLDFDSLRQREVYPFGAVPGTGISVNANQFTLQEPMLGQAALWFGDRGAVLAGEGGRVLPLMEGASEPGLFGAGASFVVERDGVRQVGTVLSNPGNSSGLRVSDSVTAVVRRNGVVIG